jgi:hypothetical protein
LSTDLAHIAVVRVVHVDQGAQAGAGLDVAAQGVVGFGDRQQRTWVIGEQIVLPFDLHDVGVFGDRPERPVLGNVHPGHRSVGTAVSQRLVQSLLIGVGLRIGQHPRGGVGDPVVGLCGHGLSCCCEELDGCQFITVWRMLRPDEKALRPFP